MSDNLQGAFQELMKTGHVNTSGIAVATAPAPARARGAGVRGGMPAPAAAPVAPVRENSRLKALKAEARMRYGQQKKNEQNLDPTGEKLASVLAEATPVEDFNNTNAESPELAAAFNEFKAEKAAMKPVLNMSPAFLERKKDDQIYGVFFKPHTVYSKIGRKLYDAYNKYKTTGNEDDIKNYYAYLLTGYPKDYVNKLIAYMKRNYAELKDHFAYYNAKGSSGGRRHKKMRRHSRKAKTSRGKLTRRR